MDEKESRSNKEVVPGGEKRAVRTHQEVFYSAPIPPASEFERYEKVLPGSANRILVMAERQSKHRLFMEKFLGFNIFLQSFFGQVSALVVVISGMAIGLYLIMHDKPTSGFLSILTPLSIIAGGMLIDRKLKKEDKESKKND